MGERNWWCHHLGRPHRASLGRGRMLSHEGRKMAVVQWGPEAPRDRDPEGSVLVTE